MHNLSTVLYKSTKKYGIKHEKHAGCFIHLFHQKNRREIPLFQLEIGEEAHFSLLPNNSTYTKY